MTLPIYSHDSASLWLSQPEEIPVQYLTPRVDAAAQSSGVWSLSPLSKSGFPPVGIHQRYKDHDDSVEDFLNQWLIRCSQGFGKLEQSLDVSGLVPERCTNQQHRNPLRLDCDRGPNDFHVQQRPVMQPRN